MAFLNKLLMSSFLRAQKSRDPKEIKARQAASKEANSRGIGRGNAGIFRAVKGEAAKRSKGVPDYAPMPGTQRVNGPFGIGNKIVDALRERQQGAPMPDRTFGAGFGGFGMAGGAAGPNVKGDRSGLPPMSLAEILAQRNIQFNPFQSGKQGLPQKMPQGEPMPQVQPAPPMQEPAKPQPEMVNFLSKLVQQGVYPDLATAFRATMQQPQQPSDMGGPAGGPMGDRGPSGIAQMLPLVAGRLFGGR